MKYLISLCLLLTCCVRKPFELEQISEDVIKSGKGVDIEVKPIPKQTIGKISFKGQQC